METQTPSNMAEIPKSESYKRHQRQRFWQIIAPVGFGVVLILVIIALIISTAVGTGAGGPVSQWADTSLIWLSLPVLLFALVLALILIVMIYLVARILKILPDYTFLAQHYVNLISGFIQTWSDKLVAPMIAFRGFSASVAALLGSLFGPRKA